MNVLAKTKKHFLGPIKVNDVWQRHPSFQTFLGEWNTLLSSVDIASYDTHLQSMRSKHPRPAMAYVESTWLIFKEKLVRYYINLNLHFGVTMASLIEGCHATPKKHLQRGHGDLRIVYTRLDPFWQSQY